MFRISLKERIIIPVFISGCNITEDLALVSFSFSFFNLREDVVNFILFDVILKQFLKLCKV